MTLLVSKITSIISSSGMLFFNERKTISGSGVETNFSWNVMRPFFSKYISDINDNMEVRGFEQPKVPVPTFSNLKLSAKFNLHNYPVIGQARITPFLYTQAGFSLLDMAQ